MQIRASPELETDAKTFVGTDCPRLSNPWLWLYIYYDVFFTQLGTVLPGFPNDLM